MAIRSLLNRSPWISTHDGFPMAKEYKSELMTAEETCRYLKITQRTLYRYLQNHQIPAFKLGKEWRFVRSDLEQWIRDRTRLVS
jgi:excisionase family DNA binding protein